MTRILNLSGLAAVVCLALGPACGSGSGTGAADAGGSPRIDAAESPRFRVEVSVDGLIGELVLDLNGDEELSVSADGVATFSAALEPGARYSVSVVSAPGLQGCSLDQAEGVVDMDTVRVDATCFGLRFFAADDGINGSELWKTDGTAENTVMVADIRPNVALPNVQNGGVSPGFAQARLGTSLLFVADDGTNGGELWRTDGTAEGTSMVKDINVGATSSAPQYLTVVGETLFFAANDGLHGNELWKSDGTKNGTVLVKDLIVGTSNGSPASLVNVSGVLLFAASELASGRELWRSDGTEAGTTLVKDIRPGGSASEPLALTVLDSRVVFSAIGPNVGREAYVSDGTEAGTALLKKLSPAGNSFPDTFYRFGNEIFFSARRSTVTEKFWKTDGTAAGTVPLLDSDSMSLRPQGLFGGETKLYFAATTSQHGEELWVTDGSEGGAKLVVDVLAGPGGGVDRVLGTLGDMVFFDGTADNVSIDLWKSDGTVDGTQSLALRSDGQASYPRGFRRLNDSVALFFANDAALGRELWRTDGTVEGTGLVLDINPGPANAQ